MVIEAGRKGGGGETQIKVMESSQERAATHLTFVIGWPTVKSPHCGYERIFYRKCARGWDELWNLPKVTLRVTWNLNSEMTPEIVCVLGWGEAAVQQSKPEAGQSFCKASRFDSWKLALFTIDPILPSSFYSHLCSFHLPRQTLGEYLLYKCLNGKQRHERNLHKCWTLLLCPGPG